MSARFVVLHIRRGVQLAEGYYATWSAARACVDECIAERGGDFVIADLFLEEGWSGIVWRSS